MGQYKKREYCCQASDSQLIVEMVYKWCVLLVAVWIWSPSPSSGLSLSDRKHGNSDFLDPVFSDQDEISVGSSVRVIRQTGVLRVRGKDGRFIYRKIGPAELSRVPRAYDQRRGYKPARKTGYVYSTPKPKPTRPPPGSETESDNDSDFVTPDPTPESVQPEVEFSITTTTTAAPDLWDIRDSVPGEPGRDYEVLSSVPETNFSCEGKTPGFYADLETRCQVFHRCSDDPWYSGQYRVNMDSFLCPNGSLFNQQIYTCDWWGNVDCARSEQYYDLNQEIGQLEETSLGTIQYVQFSGVRQPPPPGQKKKAPEIIPKDRRQPLPVQFRSKHTSTDNGHSLSTSTTTTDSNSKKAVGLSNSNGEDEFLSPEEFEPDTYRQFNADENNESSIDENDGSSQNIDEITVAPPISTSTRKSTTKKPKSSTTKKPKSTTTKKTTTTTTEKQASEETTDAPAENELAVSAATDDKKEIQGLIVNDRKDLEADALSGALTPPLANFTGEEVKPVTKEDSTDGGVYIPPTATPVPINETYLPPTRNYLYALPDVNLSYGPPTSDYLPPKRSEYLPPKHSEYLPPKHSEYLPPKRPEYGPPSKEYLPAETYLPPKHSEYLPPKQPEYGPPSKEYLPAETYLPPKHNEYLPPRPSEYGPPRREYLQVVPYLPPKQPEYGPPSREYLPAESSYLPPKQSFVYLPPNHSQYGPPSKEYLPAQHKHINEYLPPKQPEYGPPRREYLTIANEYGPPRHHEYLPPKPAEYGPPSREYLPVENTYLPPKHHEYGPPSKEYLPAESSYLPPKHSHYGPPTKEYLPPLHEKPGREYLPVTESTVRQLNYENTYSTIPDSYFRKASAGYGAPSTPPVSEYLPPTTSTPEALYRVPVVQERERGNFEIPTQTFAPPNQEFAAAQNLIKTQVEYFPARPFDPDTASTSYAPAPTREQPRQQKEEYPQSEHAGNKQHRSVNRKVEFVTAPLVSYSHVVNPLTGSTFFRK